MMLNGQTDCFSNVIQDFLICSTVHKARQLGIFTGDSYVRLSLGKMHKNSKPFSGSENPFYNEYFVFEIKCTLSELLRNTMLYEVRKRIACKKDTVLGELLIDLQSVWSQPNHCFFKKWGRLEGPIGSIKKTEPTRGYLQIDLAIVSQATNIKALYARASSVRRTSGSGAGNGAGGEGGRLADSFASSDNNVGSAGGDVSTDASQRIITDYDDIDKNLLQDIDASVDCNIRYMICVYNAVLLKKGDYLVQYRFHPFKGKSSVVKNTTHPIWNTELSFAWSFPSLAQTFILQLLIHEHLTWKCVSEIELRLEEIAFKDKPTLGPTYLHLYDSIHPLQYIGRILIEVKSERHNLEVPRQLIATPVGPIEEKRWWKTESFLVEFVALQGDFVHGNVSNMKISLRMAENVSNSVECYLKGYAAKMKTTNNLKYFQQIPPYKSVYLKIDLPDNRYKFESDIFLREILDYMKSEIESYKMFQVKNNGEFQAHAKCLRAVILNINAKIKEGIGYKRLQYSGHKELTSWDKNRLAYLQNYFNKLQDDLSSMRQKFKSSGINYVETTIEEVLEDLQKCTQDLTSMLITTRIQDEWPDLLLILSVNSTKDLAVCKLSAKFFLNPLKIGGENNASPYFWRERNFVFKDMQCAHTCMNCGCTVAIIQGCLGVVVQEERNDILSRQEPAWKQPEPFYWNPNPALSVYKCCFYIHQAKVRPGSDTSGLCDAYVRVIFGSQSAETPVIPASLSPIWNIVIYFEFIALPGGAQWYQSNPPLIAVELYDTDKQTANDYLGCGTLQLAVQSSSSIESKLATGSKGVYDSPYDFGKAPKTRFVMQKFQETKNLSPPPLKWVPMAMNGAVRAEVLMSAELIELQGHTEPVQAETAITHGIPNGIRPVMRNYVLEVVFAGFRNYNKGGRHYVKVMMGDLLLSSGLSCSRVKNSVNFLVLYSSGIVSLPQQLEYWPAIIVTDVLVSSRNSESTVGAVLIPNSRRYLKPEKPVKCLFAPPDSDFESSVGSTTVHFEDEDEESPLLQEKTKKDKMLRPFGAVIGLFRWRSQTATNTSIVSIEKSDKMDETEFNWWTKFYNSLYSNSADASKKHRLTIYHRELEKHAEFSYMHDWAEPVQLVHGVKFKKNSLPKEEAYGTLKLNIKVKPCQCKAGEKGIDEEDLARRSISTPLNPKYLAQLQNLAEMCQIIVRVYVVQGIQFRPQDKRSQSDSYIKLQFGSKVASNREHYKANESNPIYGKVFQLEGVMPKEHVLEVSVYDRNSFRDEIIGSTFIDLEDRWRSKHRATVGLPNEYTTTGYNKWRDIASPYEILLELCKEYEVKMPIFVDDTIEIDGEVFKDETQIEKSEDLQERLSLTVLRNLEKLHSFGYKLVPEHVETRPLYRNDYPGIEQGKLQLWVELYDGNLTIPAAIDITPQPPVVYELRVVIYDCSDVLLSEKNIFGSRMSDVYVKGWCHDAGEYQSTDIHHRSLDGKANFNWRMIFPVKYSNIEDMMIVKRYGGILEEHEIKQPPVLVLQLWDDDVVSRDDFIGTLEINLSNFPEPFDSPDHCKIKEDALNKFSLPFGHKPFESRKPVNLFQQHKIRGWFPMRGPVLEPRSISHTKLGPSIVTTGKIDIELEIVPENEAAMNPCGLGRDPPNALPMPVRPDTSFNPWTSPMKSMKQIFWPAFKKFGIRVLLITLAVLLVIAFIYNLPMMLMKLVIP